MIIRSELAVYIDQLLNVEQFNDYAPNGLQVEGRATIRRICTAVTASAEAIEQAIALQADALIVHHGYFWKGEASELKDLKFRRIATLIRADINLFAYHLPLDCHLDLGNNACLARLFPLQSFQSHTINKTANLLWSGSLKEATTAQNIALLLKNILRREPLVLFGNDKPIQKIAWCSGAAQDFIEEAHALGADAYISGEVSERSYYQALELGIFYFAAGHHATERYGIQALGEHLARKFDLEHQFIDSKNPI